MRIDVFTLFPQVFQPYLETSILHRAIKRQLVEINLHNIRDWTTDRHHVTDDVPYGGGGGMIMKPEPIFAAIEGVLGPKPNCPVVLLTPQGRLLDQSTAYELSAQPQLALLSGRYEGVDERVRQHLVSDEISIGDYVLSGGELPSLVLIDAIVRLLPGALGDPKGALDDSHASGLLEYPHYTRPAEFRGWEVPEILSSGDHARVARWRREQALLRTYFRRPDLLDMAELSEEDRKFLEKITQDEAAQDPTADRGD
ncbi:MAG: tRNA (guanosine(37)-N1)-methyltransferase TrmD [Chloroflexota bacterium]|nr:MAG: tRNA (guanosine(37)-N1)-methyltransferase TrmD [Chloroflexota bacterium]UCF28806.1 MAG: tRNA (guanosine(37)-N1)-methyltransferase TrmD [Chloroflexota bacterium]